MVLFWWAFCHSQFQHLSWICLGLWEIVDMHGKPERVNVIVQKVASTLGLGVVGTVCWIWQRYTYYSEKAVFRFTWHFIKGFLVWYQQFWTSHCLRPSVEGRRGVRWWSVVVFFLCVGFFLYVFGFWFFVCVFHVWFWFSMFGFFLLFYFGGSWVLFCFCFSAGICFGVFCQSNGECDLSKNIENIEDQLLSL